MHVPYGSCDVLLGRWLVVSVCSYVRPHFDIGSFHGENIVNMGEWYKFSVQVVCKVLRTLKIAKALFGQALHEPEVGLEVRWLILLCVFIMHVSGQRMCILNFVSVLFCSLS